MRTLVSLSSSIESLAVNANGTFILAASGEQVVRYDLADGVEAEVLDDGGRVALLPGDEAVVIGSDVGLWRATADGSDSEELPLGEDIEDGVGLQAIAISPDGERVACCGGQDRVEIRNVSDGALVWSGRTHKYPYALAWRGDDLIVGLWTGAFAVVTAAMIRSGDDDAEIDSVLASPPGALLDVRVHGDLAVFVHANARGGSVSVWDLARQTYVASKNVAHGMHAAAIAPDGKTVIVGGNDQAVTLYSLPQLAPLGTFQLPATSFASGGPLVRQFYPASGPHAVLGLACGPDGTAFVGLHSGRVVEVSAQELRAGNAAPAVRSEPVVAARPVVEPRVAAPVRDDLQAQLAAGLATQRAARAAAAVKKPAAKKPAATKKPAAAKKPAAKKPTAKQTTRR